MAGSNGLTNRENESIGGYSYPEMVSPKDSDLPKQGETRRFRLADRIGKAVSGIKGAPKFEIYWPQAKRDEALPKLIAFVNSLEGHTVGVVKEWGFRYRPVP